MAIISSERFKNYRLFYIANGRYVRPPDYESDSLLSRIKQAWLVFTGRCDVLQWDVRPECSLKNDTTDAHPLNYNPFPKASQRKHQND